MVFDAAGNMFVANRGSGGQILKILRNGMTSVFDTVPDDCATIAYRRTTGDLYVGCLGGNLYRYLDGNAANRIYMGDFGGDTSAAIAFDLPETALYFASSGLVVVDPDTGDSQIGRPLAKW